MKKNINVIEIRGIRGLIIAGLIVCCLCAGFIVFPGLVAMTAWNFIVSFTTQIPPIGIFQGILLWGILVALYFILRKDKFVICFKSPEGLNEEELKTVFADIKKQAQDDKILQTMLKARETELKLKDNENLNSEQMTDSKQSDAGSK